MNNILNQLDQLSIIDKLFFILDWFVLGIVIHYFRKLYENHNTK